MRLELESKQLRVGLKFYHALVDVFVVKSESLGLNAVASQGQLASTMF